MIIYKTTNLINGKIYVGQDSNNNPRYLGSGHYFLNALDKHGKENFKKEILHDKIPSQDMIDYWEQFYILQYNSVVPFGYNLEWGGNGVGKHSEETKQKMRKNSYWKGKHLSEKIKQKLSESHKGQIPWMKGKQHTEESKQKMSESLKGRKHSKTTKQKMSESKKGIKHPMFGKHHSEKTKQRWSKIRKGQIPWIKGKHHSEETKKKISKNNGMKGQIPWNKGKYKYHISKEELYNLYIIQNKSQRQITKHFNCSRIVISNRLKKYDIKKS